MFNLALQTLRTGGIHVRRYPRLVRVLSCVMYLVCYKKNANVGEVMVVREEDEEEEGCFERSLI